jgi:mono/diheme cytochrome c family protein
MSDQPQKIDPSNPDPDDSTKAARSHGRLLRFMAAAAREKRIQEDGVQPVSLTVIVVCGIILLIAGGVIGKVNLFDYKDLFRPGYARNPPADDDSGPKPKEALAAYMSRGQKLFSRCAACHGPGGKGDGVNYPSLAGSKWATGPTERFSMIVLNGLHGVNSTGKEMGGVVGMPSQSSQIAGILAPEDLAGVMTYVRNSFGNSVGDIVTVEMATKALEISGKRAKTGTQVSADELTSDHVKELPGTKLDPKTLLDPMKLTPVKGK